MQTRVRFPSPALPQSSSSSPTNEEMELSIDHQRLRGASSLQRLKRWVDARGDRRAHPWIIGFRLVTVSFQLSYC